MQVKIIQIERQAALVEFVQDGALRRMIIPADEVGNDGEVDPQVMEAGIPYGFPWEDKVTPQVTAEEIAKALRNNGIWTLEDARRNPALVVSALQSAYRVDLATILSLE